MSGFDGFGPGGLGGAKAFGDISPLGRGFRGKVFGEGLGEGDETRVEGREQFSNALNDVLMEIRSLQDESKQKVEALASGEPVEVHDLMLSMGKSEVAFNLMLEVRNKLLEAWQILQRSVS